MSFGEGGSGLPPSALFDSMQGPSSEMIPWMVRGRINVCLSPVRLRWSRAGLHLADEIFWTREEPILDQNAADDRHGMGSQNVDGERRGKEIGVVGADYRIAVVRQ